MRKVTVALPAWIGREEAQGEVVRDLCARALLKVELYRSRMKPFEARYRTTFARFRRRVEKGRRENCAAWDDLLEWEAAYTAHREWTKRYRELRQCLGTWLRRRGGAPSSARSTSSTSSASGRSPARTRAV